MKYLNKLPKSVDEIPVDGVYPGISCDGCPTSACCHDVNLPLTPDEAAGLRRSGTKLKPEKMSRLAELRHKLGAEALYEMDGPCGNLKKDSEGNSYCAVYGTDKQPKACKDFPPGCFNCIIMQLRDKRAAEGPNI